MSTADLLLPSVEARREQSRRELINILATAQFWRMRLVEGALLSCIVFFIAFAIAARL